VKHSKRVGGPTPASILRSSTSLNSCHILAPQALQVQLYGSPTRMPASSSEWASSLPAGWPHLIYLPLFKSGCGARMYTSPGMRLQLLLAPAVGSQPPLVFNGSWSSSNASYVLRFSAPTAGAYNASLRLWSANGSLQVWLWRCWGGSLPEQ
jgi:hypothetical protein